MVTVSTQVSARSRVNRVLPKLRRKRRTRARVHPTLRSRKCPIVVSSCARRWARFISVFIEWCIVCDICLSKCIVNTNALPQETWFLRSCSPFVCLVIVSAYTGQTKINKIKGKHLQKRAWMWSCVVVIVIHHYHQHDQQCKEESYDRLGTDAVGGSLHKDRCGPPRKVASSESANEIRELVYLEIEACSPRSQRKQ